MNKRIFLVCLMFIVGMLVDQLVFSQGSEINTWPQFRGANASGVANAEQDPPIEFGPAENVLWKTPVISGMSSPCIWGDRIFLTGFDKEKQQLQVLCYQRSDGKLIWNRMVPAKEIEPFHLTGSPADATPATDGERIYVHFGSYGLLCYDFAGNLLWTIELPVSTNKFGTGTSPIVVDNLVILIVIRPQKQRYLLAVDSRSGQQIWKQSVRASHASPIRWGKELVVHGSHHITGYRLADGSPVWWIKVKTSGTSTPVVSDSMLYVGSWTQWGEENQRIKLPSYHDLLKKYDTDLDSLVSKQEFPKVFEISRRPEVQELPNANINIVDYWGFVDKNNNKYIDRSEWNKYLDIYTQIAIDHGLLAIKSGGSGNITASHVLWKENKSIPEVPSPLFYKGRIYMIKNGGIVTCLEALTGKLLYRTRLKAAGPYFSSPIAANDRIYIASAKGTVVVFAVGDELKVLARNELGEKIKATPAIVDDKLYVRTAKHLYAFGK